MAKPTATASDLKNLVSAFQRLDPESTGLISRPRLSVCLQRLGMSETNVKMLLSCAPIPAEELIPYEQLLKWIVGDEAPEVSDAAYVSKVEKVDAVEDAKIKAQGCRRRSGVAAERMDPQAMKDYKKPVYPKDDASTEKLRASLDQNDKMQVLMGHLDSQAVNDVVNAFYTKEFAKGQDIIKQGDQGDCLYIIDAGDVDIFVNRPGADGQVPDGKGPKVVSWTAGALFGELALMYNAPRAATVTAASEQVTTYVLDAVDFKMLLAQSSQSTYAKYEGWLTEVELLKVLNHFELAQVADALESEFFDVDEVILAQGEEGDKFYILEDGSAAAYITGDSGEKLAEEYNEVGSYFGEIALLKEGERRQATVRATGQGCSVVSLSASHFKDVLGPLHEILQKHLSTYPRYADLL